MVEALRTWGVRDWLDALLLAVPVVLLALFILLAHVGVALVAPLIRTRTPR